MRFGPVEIRWGQGGEKREQPLENPLVPLSDTAGMASLFGMADWAVSVGIVVNADTVMSVPAYACGVNFLARTMAALPFHEFKKAAGGTERVERGMIAGMLAGTVNDDYLTSYKWREQSLRSVFLTGAGRTWIEQDAGGKPVNLWPLETRHTTKERVRGRTRFVYRDGGPPQVYPVAEVLDLVWADKLDGVSIFNPVERYRDLFALALVIEKYGLKFFGKGGVPPLALKGAIGSPGAAARAKKDVNATIASANANGDPILLVPDGYELVPVAFDPQKAQLVDWQRFLVEQFARILNLPPIFLQDLTHGSFANTEQQDLHVSKHTVAHWCEQLETECNAKFYGPRNFARYVELGMDGLQRGDFKTRMEGNARAIQTGQLTPNEARARENRPPLPGGDDLLVQGATVPLEKAGETANPPGQIGDMPVDPQSNTEGESTDDA